MIVTAVYLSFNVYTAHKLFLFDKHLFNKFLSVNYNQSKKKYTHYYLHPQRPHGVPKSEIDGLGVAIAERKGQKNGLWG
jgi:hypothetical protein